jgi:hypothetical protein
MKEMTDGCEKLDASGWLGESITDRIVSLFDPQRAW